MVVEVATKMGWPSSSVSVASLKLPFLAIFQGPDAARVSHVLPKSKPFISFIISFTVFTNRRRKLHPLLVPNRDLLFHLSQSPIKYHTGTLLVVIGGISTCQS